MKNCNLCKNLINTKLERYIHVEDWNKEVKYNEMWCHLSCFNKSMNRELTQLEKDAKEVLRRGLPILQNFTGKKEEVYELK